MALRFFGRFGHNRLADIANAARVLEEASKKISLEINTEKTKIMELIESEEDLYEMEDTPILALLFL